MVNSDPEELLRSIERTREELAHTVDTIAGRLDPKRAAKRGVGAVRDGVTNVVEGAKVKLHLATDGVPTGPAQAAPAPGENTAASVAAANERAKAILAEKAAAVAARAKRAPKPAAGGLAALVALAAIIAVKRRRR